MEFDHRCQRSDDAEAETRNLLLFSRFCPSRRAGTYPVDYRVQALRLMGRHGEAISLRDHVAARIPVQRVQSVDTVSYQRSMERIRARLRPDEDPHDIRWRLR